MFSSSVIPIKGSATLITDYLRFSIYSILFLRGVYSVEDFFIINKYGLELVVALNEELEAYVGGVLDQVEEWLVRNTVRQVVLLIASKESKEVLERWVFEVSKGDHSKTEEEMNREVHLMLAGIRGTNSMLSDIQEPTLCNIVVYKRLTGSVKDDVISDAWEEAEQTGIPLDDSSEVKLKSAATQHHKLELTVVYKA
ncbi:Mitotic spindle checkpoint component mad2 [Tulasnella sp. 419]|nr:Mitotic spindle checkpoint component mad2 [Tulasnella sp. 419]